MDCRSTLDQRKHSNPYDASQNHRPTGGYIRTDTAFRGQPKMGMAAFVRTTTTNMREHQTIRLRRDP